MVNDPSGTVEYKRSISDKLERTFAIQQDLIYALKAHGCPSCLEILKQVIEKYVGPSLPTAANLKTISNGADQMTLVFEQDISEELFKDVFYQDQLSNIWKLKPRLSSLYELNINHGVSCICCTPIPKPITTCPPKADQLRSHARGRPRMKGAV